MEGCAVIGPAAPFNSAWRDIGQLIRHTIVRLSSFAKSRVGKRDPLKAAAG